MSHSEPVIFDSFDYSSNDEIDTDRLGAALAYSLAPGSVVGFVGNLGAGKTRIIRAIATTLGVDPRDVTSPTFSLIHEYTGRLPIYHLDAYRLRDANELLELGILELMAGTGVCLIEWADRVQTVLPVDHLKIEIDVTKPTSRKFRMRAYGSRSQMVLSATRACLRENTAGPDDA